MKTRRIVGDRFWEKVILGDNGCLNWIGSKNELGYGDFWYEERLQKAHRVAYKLLVGEIPKGLDLDHLCRNPSCVAPDHLEPVTHAENVRRGNWRATIVANRKKITQCQYGHPLDGLNNRSHRFCKTCTNKRARDKLARRSLYVRPPTLH